MFLKSLLAKLRCNKGEVSLDTPVIKDEPGAKESSGQSQGDAKLEGLIADIDLSDVPEDQRDMVKKHLVEKVRNYDTGFKTKSQDLAEQRKEFESQKKEVESLVQLRNEIQSNPVLEKEIQKVINQARSGTLGESQKSTDKQVKHIDRLLDQATDAETRETLRQLKTIVEESVPGEDVINSAVEKALAPFKDQLFNLQKATQTGQAERIESELTHLSEELGKEFVDKHKDQVKATALKMNASPKDIKRLLYHYADDSELETVILNKAKRKKEIEEKRKMEGSSVDIFGQTKPIELKKDKVGRTDIRDLVSKILS